MLDHGFEDVRPRLLIALIGLEDRHTPWFDGNPPIKRFVACGTPTFVAITWPSKVSNMSQLLLLVIIKRLGFMVQQNLFMRTVDAGKI
jgi:hypothetical protein